MLKSVSSRRYAQAIFEIAKQKNEFDAWTTDLKRLAALMQDAEFAALIENPKLPFNLKAKWTEQKLGKASKAFLNLVQLLITKDKIRYAGQISSDYEWLLDEYRGIKHADVKTATPVDDMEKKTIVNRLEKLLGKKVAVNLRVDPLIIGGIVIRIGDSLIDGSIRSKLDTLKKELMGASY